MNIDKKRVEEYVNSVVRKYSNRGISDKELFDVGMEAALKVIEENKDNSKFDMVKDYRFNWFVRQAITRKVNENISANVSNEDVELINNYFKFIRKYKSYNRKEPSDKEIINNLNIDENKLRDIRNIIEKV